jgi:hypothetical protein
MPRAAWHWGGDNSVVNDPFGALGSSPSYNTFHPYGALRVVIFCSLVLMQQKMEHRNKREMVEVIQRSSLTHSLHLKVDSSQQGASSSGIPLWGADSISQPGEAKKTTGAGTHQL